MPWYFFVIDWFYFFSCKIIFFSWIQQFCIFSSEREPNGNIKQSMRFDGTFMQMDFWKTSSHIIFVIRRAILHQVQVLFVGKMMVYSLRASKSHLSWRQNFLRSPLFFAIMMITVYWQNSLRIFLRINRGSFRILRIFCFESFFGTYNVDFYYCVKFL